MHGGGKVDTRTQFPRKGGEGSGARHGGAKQKGYT